MPVDTHNHKKEFIAELLRERIYATLALLAVLISIDARHTSPGHALMLVSVTIVSLWAASIVSVQMSRRLIFQDELDSDFEFRHQIQVHAPMLASLIFPAGMIILAIFDIVPLNVAINISILSALALLVGWSIGSARALKAKRMPTFLLVIIELAIGLGVVGLKLVSGH